MSTYQSPLNDQPQSDALSAQNVEQQSVMAQPLMTQHDDSEHELAAVVEESASPGTHFVVATTPPASEETAPAAVETAGETDKDKEEEAQEAADERSLTAASAKARSAHPARNGTAPAEPAYPASDVEHDEIEDLDGEAYEEPSVEPQPRARSERSSLSDFDQLFMEWTQTRDPKIRERLILMNRNLVSYIARRFMDRGEMSEDIIQQGLIGLINALDHFDPTRGVRFATFATPTIMGEIRRYFRDKSWGIRVPRRLQELNQAINARIEELTQEFDRSPTYAEIARSLNLQLEEVVEALEMASAMEPISIDEEISFGRDDASTVVGDQIGVRDPQLESWGDYAALEAALEKLPEKERRVLQLAYFHDHSQVEIARHMKVSQMFVSRLQRRALAHLRELINSHDI